MAKGQPFTPGNPGNSGGKRGRSGRKRLDFVHWCEAVLKDPTVRAVMESRAKAGDIRVLELAAKYCQPQPPQQHKINATVTFKAVKE